MLVLVLLELVFHLRVCGIHLWNPLEILRVVAVLRMTNTK